MRVTWRLSPRAEGTAVAAEFVIERATTLDRVLLAAGAAAGSSAGSCGQRWTISQPGYIEMRDR